MEQQYVAIDLHRRRSVIVREDEAGRELGVVRIDNDPVAWGLALAEASDGAEVAIEATYGWYWAVDVLAAQGARVRLVHPSGLHWERRRVKNDYVDCKDLLNRLHLGRLPEAWIAPPAVRELRELVRYRAKLVALGGGLKAQIHAVLAKEGVIPPAELWGRGGGRFLDEVALGEAYTIKVESLRDLIELYDREVTMVAGEIHQFLADDKGYWAIQALPGVGPTLAGVFVAEIGDVTRFERPDQLCSWAGLTPRHRESDEEVKRGKITKQGSALVRSAPGDQDRPDRGGPQASHPRLLRPTRRRDPMPRAGRRRRVSRLDTASTRARRSA